MIYICVFLGLFFLGFGFMSKLIIRPSRTQARLRQFVTTSPPIAEEKTVRRDRIEIKKMFKQTGGIFSNRSSARKWAIRLERAGLSIRAEEFILTKYLLLALIFLATIFILPILLDALLALVGYMAPNFYVQYQYRQRISRLRKQLPTVIGTLATSLRSGFSFIQAMQFVAEETPDPLGTEFSKTIKEISLGLAIEESFEQLHERLPDPDFKIVITALLVQRTTGGNLSTILETIRETIEDRIRVKDEMRTLTSQGRISSWLVTMLPVAMAIILFLAERQYMVNFLQSKIGDLMMGVGLILELVGWFVIQKIVNIEV